MGSYAVLSTRRKVSISDTERYESNCRLTVSSLTRTFHGYPRVRLRKILAELIKESLTPKKTSERTPTSAPELLLTELGKEEFQRWSAKGGGKPPLWKEPTPIFEEQI